MHKQELEAQVASLKSTIEGLDKRTLELESELNQANDKKATAEEHHNKTVEDLAILQSHFEQVC